MDGLLQHLSLSSITLSVVVVIVVHTAVSIIITEASSRRQSILPDDDAYNMALAKHVPPVPSPLNPSPTRRGSTRRPGNMVLCKGSGRVQMSPAEKLLRRKAAAAWVSETTYRQEALYRRRALEDAVISRVGFLP